MSGTDKQGPLVSVVVPAWNAQTTLEETLRSVAAQTHSHLEIIIIDDGSSDHTAAIAEDFCTAEPRARMIRKENGGVASARNLAISETLGEWIAPIDSDDLWHPTRIEKMLAAASEATEPPGFVYCWCRHIDSRGQVIGSGPRWSVNGRAFRQLAYLNVVGNGSGLLLSREAITEIGGYDPSLRAEQAQGAEDLLVQIRVGVRHPVALVPEHLVGWRHSAQSMSADAGQMHRSCRLVYQRLAADGTPVPRRIAGWMMASSAFDLAEHHAAAGNWRTAMRWLSEALRLDPLRSGLFLAYRILRSVRRRSSRARPLPRWVHFYDVDPSACLASEPFELPRLSRLLRSIDRRRLERLAKSDAGLLESAG